MPAIVKLDECRITNEAAWRPINGIRHVEKNRIDYLTWTQAKRLPIAPPTKLLTLTTRWSYGQPVSQVVHLGGSRQSSGTRSLHEAARLLTLVIYSCNEKHSPCTAVDPFLRPAIE